MISLRPPRNTWSRIDPAGWLVGTARAGAAGDAATSGFRLICYPHAGGSTAAFRPWQVVAGDAAALAVLQMPGRDQRLTEAPTVSIAAVADAVASVLTDPETGGATSPVVLYGHSMGTLVALEVAHRLVAAGQPPLLLVLGARVPPHLSTPAARMLDLDDDAFFDGLDRAYGGTPVTVRNDPSMRQHYIRIMRGDFRLSADYITDFAAISAGRPPLPCPLLAFSGDADRAAPATAMAEWRGYGAAGFNQVTLPGGHFFAIERPRPVVSRIIAAATRLIG
ncbi:thioesterase [Tistrella bauzanensis]|uniref:Thioesterase n=1 Tax=Tistrella bauzanensis TaxID=657419 RepID=A0ABQ1J6W7_9PROT|nr:alpha/beta fold hydrolase [Tistrella bauzanensis]GGB61275.1 thioesterase [Tistrella bauzanensis]